MAKRRLDEVEIGTRFPQRRRKGGPEPVGRTVRDRGEHAPGHWVFDDSADLHYRRPEAAGQALEVLWNSPMAAAMFAELDAIHADRHVARIDVHGSGEFTWSRRRMAWSPNNLKPAWSCGREVEDEHA